MTGVFLEVVLVSADLVACGIQSRDEVEDPIHEALMAEELGEVSGGGSGGGHVIIDVDIFDERNFSKALMVLRQLLKDLNVPPSTTIKRSAPVLQVYRLSE